MPRHRADPAAICGATFCRARLAFSIGVVIQFARAGVYRREGYEFIGELKDYILAGHSELIFFKKLS